MIKFFRKIRQRLLTEKKFSKYLLYAIGEIFLVVIGILIALQINNWNENRKQVNAEKVFLSGIKADLLKDKEFIDYVLNYIEPKLNVYRSLNEADQQDYSTNKIEVDSLLSIYLFSGQRTFYPVSGSYQSAVAGNEINTFKRKEVIQIIKLYSSTYDRIVDNGEILDNRWDNLSKLYSHERRTKQFSNVNMKNLSLVLDDIHFHYLQLDWYENILNKTKVEIDELLHKLDE
jgi:hypothetical protein